MDVFLKMTWIAVVFSLSLRVLEEKDPFLNYLRVFRAFILT